MMCFRWNDTLSQSVRRPPLEMAKGFTINNPLDLLGHEAVQLSPKIAGSEVYDAVA